MANLSSFLTTSFHTQLSFLDADSEENLLDEDEEEDQESFENSSIPDGHNKLTAFSKKHNCIITQI